MGLNLKSKIGLKWLVRKRDRINDKIAYNEKYPELVLGAADAKGAKKRMVVELAAKKALYPLEMAAMPVGEANGLRRKEAVADFVKKQELPRRAVAQSIKRKPGEAAALEAKLKRMDVELAEFEKQMLLKYPETGDAAAKENVEKYQAAMAVEDKKLADFDALHSKQRDAAAKALADRAAKKNAGLKKALDQANAKLDAIYAPQAHQVPEGGIIGINNVKMFFQGIRAVDDLSFAIREGEIFGLIGPNGAGKSTLFNCITRFYKATDGKIFYRDKFGHVVDMDNYDTHDVAKTGIVRTFQNLELMIHVSVLDNLLIGGHIYFRSNLFQQFVRTKKLRFEEAASRQKALDILEKMGLTQYKDMLPSGLPYGVLKKVELARTLMTEPRLIILDEPAAGLNDAETEDLAEIIRQIRADYNCTIFLVEHDMNLVMNVCDRVCAIAFGKMLAIGTPEEIQGSTVVQEAYLGVKEEGE